MIALYLSLPTHKADNSSKGQAIKKNSLFHNCAKDFSSISRHQLFALSTPNNTGLAESSLCALDAYRGPHSQHSRLTRGILISSQLYYASGIGVQLDGGVAQGEVPVMP